jgi:hypothetical protein
MSNFYSTNEFKEVPLDYEKLKYKLNLNISCPPKPITKTKPKKSSTCTIELKYDKTPSEENIVEPTKESFKSNTTGSPMQINMYPLILDEPLYKGMYEFDKEFFINCEIKPDYYNNFINLVELVESEEIPTNSFTIGDYIKRKQSCPEMTDECIKDDDEPAAASLDEPTAASLDEPAAASRYEPTAASRYEPTAASRYEPAAASLDEDIDESPDETLDIYRDESPDVTLDIYRDESPDVTLDIYRDESESSDSSFKKYLKYKTKYLALKKKLNIY